MTIPSLTSSLQVGISALKEGEISIVQSSMIGSILSSILLVRLPSAALVIPNPSHAGAYL